MKLRILLALALVVVALTTLAGPASADKSAAYVSTTACSPLEVNQISGSQTIYLNVKSTADPSSLIEWAYFNQGKSITDFTTATFTSCGEGTGLWYAVLTAPPVTEKDTVTVQVNYTSDGKTFGNDTFLFTP